MPEISDVFDHTTATLADAVERVLLFPPIDRTRRNHGLEHATITILSQRFRNTALVGRSTPNGFYLHGNVSTDAVAHASAEALRRLQAGEAQLAIHPNCGTNFVVAGLAASLAALIGFWGAERQRDHWERLPLVMALSVLALIGAQPLGLAVQRELTTSGEPRKLRIVSLTRRETGNIVTHFVATAD